MQARSAILFGTLLLLASCEPAADVRVQELPPLARSSVEARLGLPELAGAWRFAGWELAEEDTLGLDAELPGFGVLWLRTQKRDSLAGSYLTGGGVRTPLVGEVRRDSTVSLVAFPAPEDGKYLVGEVRSDTIWIRMTTLVEPGAWRGNARAAFVRSETALSPFRRVRGRVPPPAAADSAALASATDTLPMGATLPATVPPGADTRPTATSGLGQARPGVSAPRQPSVVPPSVPSTPATGAGAPVAEAPLAETGAETEPEPEPVVIDRQPPRVLGVPIDSIRDD